MKKVLITQSNYIPWKGYFDAIALADELVIYDDMQFTRQDWRNRNQIKTPQGLKWLSIPVEMKDRLNKKINEMKISDKKWNISHLDLIKQSYKNAPNYLLMLDWIEPLYRNCHFELLSDINLYFINEFNDFLGIKTDIRNSSEFRLVGDRTERLINICKELGATEYLSGPAAKSYLDEPKFKNAGIDVLFLDYSGYPEYPQLYGNFVHQVSILDLFFNVGNEAKKYLKISNQ
jgi:hypothetical protein